MYAYVKVIIERPDVQALPLDALVYSGDQTFCWLYESGKAVRTELETGVSDDEWIEVTNRRPPVAPGGAQRLGTLDADRRHGTGDPRRFVGPRRWRPRGGRPGDGGDETRERDARPRSSSGEDRTPRQRLP